MDDRWCDSECDIYREWNVIRSGRRDDSPPTFMANCGRFIGTCVTWGSPGRFIGGCGGWAGAGAGLRHGWVKPSLGYAMAGLSHPWVTSGRGAQGAGVGRSRLYTLLLSRAYPYKGGGCDHTLWGGGVTPTTEVNEKAKPFDFAFLPTLMRGKLPSPYGL